MSSKNPKPQSQWRYTYETQAQIPALKLYLINPTINPLLQCHNLKSSLNPSNSILEVSWIDLENSEELLVKVPIPKVLIDFEEKLECRSRDDCVEIKIGLILAVDHEIVVHLMGLESVGLIGIGNELEKLSTGDVHLFCKVCSSRLTKQPIRYFKEMPSVDWREVADNWFGACCCSFGGISEKLVLQYIKNYNCTKGTSLLDSASVIVCMDDLEGCTFSELDGSLRDTVKENCENESKEVHLISAISTCADHEKERKALDSEYNHEKHVHTDCHLDQLSLNETQETLVEDSLNLNNDSGNCKHSFAQSTDCSAEHCHCCPDKTSSEVICRPEKIQKWMHDCSLGSGFITRNSNLSTEVEWNEFSCRNCSSFLGAYPSYKNKNTSVDGGIRLFKCYLSTSIPVGGPHDKFRNYTLEKVFVASLLDGAKDELSYKVVLRDLKTKSPVLQIVLLNSDLWSSTGYCSETATVKPNNEAKLQPIVKVLFSDCRTGTEASSRMIKDWCSKTHTEEFYMMTHQIEELTKCLKSTANHLPNSCSYFQGMSLSSMKR